MSVYFDRKYHFLANIEISDLLASLCVHLLGDPYESEHCVEDFALRIRKLIKSYKL